MSERNEQITGLLAADAPSERDTAFEVAVMARIEQRRFRRGMTMNVALALVGAIALALLTPEIGYVWQHKFAGMLSDAMVTALLISGTLSLQWWFASRS